MTPTQIYVDPVLTALREDLPIRSLAHITGGGLPENLPRCLAPHQSLEINTQSWRIPAIFEWIAATGDIALAEMFNTFNMGIGMVAIVPPGEAETTVQWFQRHDWNSWVAGTVIEGTGEAILSK